MMPYRNQHRLHRNVRGAQPIHTRFKTPVMQRLDIRFQRPGCVAHATGTTLGMPQPPLHCRTAFRKSGPPVCSPSTKRGVHPHARGVKSVHAIPRTVSEKFSLSMGWVCLEWRSRLRAGMGVGLLGRNPIAPFRNMVRTIFSLWGARQNFRTSDLRPRPPRFRRVARVRTAPPSVRIRTFSQIRPDASAGQDIRYIMRRALRGVWCREFPGSGTRSGSRNGARHAPGTVSGHWEPACAGTVRTVGACPGTLASVGGIVPCESRFRPPTQQSG